MTKNRNAKQVVRARMAETGENYTRARRAVGQDVTSFLFAYGRYYDEGVPVRVNLEENNGAHMLIAGIPGAGKTWTARHLIRRFLDSIEEAGTRLVVVDGFTYRGYDNWAAFPGAVHVGDSGRLDPEGTAEAIVAALRHRGPALVVADSLGFRDGDPDAVPTPVRDALLRVVREGRSARTQLVTIVQDPDQLPAELVNGMHTRLVMGRRLGYRSPYDAAAFTGMLDGADPELLDRTGSAEGWLAGPGDAVARPVEFHQDRPADLPEHAAPWWPAARY